MCVLARRHASHSKPPSHRATVVHLPHLPAGLPAGAIPGDERAWNSFPAFKRNAF